MNELFTAIIAKAPESVPETEYQCAICRDRGWQVVGNVARPCACRTNRPIEARLAGVGVPAKLLHCSWENCDGADVFQGRLAAFPSPDSSAVLWGPTGTGKSHVAVAVVREFMLVGGSAVFMEAARLISECRASYDRGEQPEEVIRRYLKPDIRILEEAWTDRKTEMADDMTSQFIRRCLADGRPLIVTTNLTEDQVNSIEPRVASRIFGIGSVSIDFTGLPDRRRL